MHVWWCLEHTDQTRTDQDKMSKCCLFQVSSAIQNQDFTLVDDYISGLKTLLYMQVGRKACQTCKIPGNNIFLIIFLLSRPWRGLTIGTGSLPQPPGKSTLTMPSVKSKANTILNVEVKRAFGCSGDNK